MTGTTLTRAEAITMIDESRGDAETLRAIAIAWIGHADIGSESTDVAEEFHEMLCDYVSECCLDDDIRSRGPRDSDDTGILRAAFVYGRLPDGTVPNCAGDVSAFADWNAFVAALWADTDADTRHDYPSADEFASCCMLDQNGVYVVHARPDGRIDIEHVG